MTFKQWHGTEYEERERKKWKRIAGHKRWIKIMRKRENNKEGLQSHGDHLVNLRCVEAVEEKIVVEAEMIGTVLALVNVVILADCVVEVATAFVVVVLFTFSVVFVA